MALFAAAVHVLWQNIPWRFGFKAFPVPGGGPHHMWNRFADMGHQKLGIHAPTELSDRPRSPDRGWIARADAGILRRSAQPQGAPLSIVDGAGAPLLKRPPVWIDP